MSWHCSVSALLAGSAKLRQPTGQRQSNVRTQHFFLIGPIFYSYIKRKVWDHQIWIQIYLGFIVSDLTYMYVFKSTPYSITLCPLCRVYNQIPLCNLSLALISSVSPRLILRKRQKQKTKKIHKMPKVQISPENKIYDGDGYLLRVACVCVRDNSENEVCVHDLLKQYLGVLMY